MLEDQNVFIITYLLVLLVQGVVSSLKRGYWGWIPILASSIFYVFTVERDVFILICFQLGLHGVNRLARFLVDAYLGKRKQAKINKSIIKDL
ncbi:MAG: hypothetical protein WC399_02125 [Bacilli bacterium]|jgi:hypothetical protein